MRRVLINATASTAGGGRTYLFNVLPRLVTDSPEWLSLTVLVPARHLGDYRQIAAGPRLTIEAGPAGEGIVARLRWEETTLRRMLREREIDLLVSAGNFALRASPVPQILFSRNDLYFSRDFVRDLVARGEWAMLGMHLVKSRLARSSIRQATINVTPTEAFAAKIRAARGLRGCRIEVAQFGIEAGALGGGEVEQPSRVPAKGDRLRLLCVSHYNYFRNFETLLRAMPELAGRARRETGHDVELVLTTTLGEGIVHGGYDTTQAARLIDKLGIGRMIVMLGEVPYRSLRELYESSDLVVCPSYAESFGHPLLEAMALGVPVLAAETPVHREICGDAAAWFPTFDPHQLATEAARLLGDAGIRRQMVVNGLARSQRFPWENHVHRLLSLITAALPVTSV